MLFLLQVINVEWGNFFSKSLPRTFADEGLDKDSLNPGRQVSSKSTRFFCKLIDVL
jgi:hexokinase